MPTDEKESKVSFSHVPSLDGLRAIAVLLVMFYHLELLVPGLRMVAPGGFLGVDVFFVLSGFLITSILLKEYSQTARISLSGFYLRRTLRLVPAFWLFLIVLYLGGDLLLPVKEAAIIYSENNFLYSLTYLMNWHRGLGAVTGNLNHTWSLAIEEQFYVIWSLLLFKAFGISMSRKQIAVGTACLIVILVIQRAVRTAGGTDIDVLYYSTDTRIDAILIGCLTSLIYCWKLIPPAALKSRMFDRITLASLIVGSGIVISFQHQDRLLYYGFLSIFSVSTAVSILWLVSRETSLVHKVLEIRGLRWIGQISYGLYLWHYVLYEFAKNAVPDTMIQVVLGIGLAFGVSVLSFYFLEQPILRLKTFSLKHLRVKPAHQSPSR